jgi:arsenite methyltransferase
MTDVDSTRTDWKEMWMRGSAQGCWAEWVLRRKFAGEPDQQRALDRLRSVRDQVLDHADVADGNVLLDVGAGDGLIAFGALETVGAGGRVIFSDISQDLLDHYRSLAREMGVLDRCQLLRASADDLSSISDAAVDVLTTRSVLIHVKAKREAFHEFYRVLRPKGRLSLFEPINRFAYPEPPHLFAGYDVAPVLDLASKVRALCEGIQPPDDPMLDFDERDLLRLAEEAGFREAHLEIRADVQPLEPRSWDYFPATSGNPRVPALGEAMDETLTHDEVERLSNHLRPLVEAGKGTWRMALSCLWAVK